MKITGYTIEGQIGQGGMARVYRAIHDALGRPVALKVMNPLFADDPAFSERFLDEGRLLAALQHPHIMTIYDIGVSDGLHYLSMEYVGGGDLKRRIQDGLSPDAALAHVLAIGSGLKVAHDAHIVHRDVKPANILFRLTGDLLLTDFGIAKQLASNKGLTATGSMVGSPYYLSPEQALGQPIDGRADIYSLGIVFYEMLVGQKPFEGDSELDVAMKHIEGKLPRLPQDLFPFQALLDRMTAKSPDDRFPDIDHFLEAARSLRDKGSWSGSANGLVAGTGLAANNASSILADKPAAPNAAEDGMGFKTDPRVVEQTVILPGRRQTQDRAADNGQTQDVHPISSRLGPHVRRITAGKIGRLTILGGVLMLAVIMVAGILSGAQDDAKVPVAAARKTEQPAQSVESIRQAELERQVELERQAELKRQVEIKKQEEIDRLLLSAQDALSQYKLMTPAQESAYTYYQEVLKRDPENRRALEGFSLIADRYLAMATKAFNQGQDANAKRYVALGLRVKHDHAGLLALRDRLTSQKQPVVKSVDRFFRRVKGIFD